jgi:hypothetical protein
LLPLIIALLGASPLKATPATPATPPRCEYGQHALDLGFEAFDQDMKGGWRELAHQDGCEDKAADLVRSYRQKYQSIMPLLYWHEAQIRASIGENKEAISLMRATRETHDGDQSGWNPYVDATIAFLRNDKSAFLQARARLEQFKKPRDWPADAEWPQNGSVVAGLWKCFGKPYKIAYGVLCRPSSARPR